MGHPSNTMKRARSEGNRSLVLLVPPAAVALVIGKGGSTIKEIQQNSTANVTFEKQDTFLQGAPHRRVTITSGRWSANIAAQAAILRIIQSVDSVVATQAGTVTLRLLVPNGSCSLLIGKKGVQINQISSDSGAKIQIARAEEMPAELQAVERLVIIESRTSEAEQQVTSACAMISDKLGDAIDSGVGGGDFNRQHTSSNSQCSRCTIIRRQWEQCNQCSSHPQ